MTRIFQDAIRAFLEVMRLVPMPWRVGLIVLVAVLFFYQVVWRLLGWAAAGLPRFALFLVEGIASLLLLPEYWITKHLRRHGRQPLPGAYVFGDMLQAIIGPIHTWTTRPTDARKQRRLKKRWVALVVAIPILLWYVRPFLEDTRAARYIDYGVSAWYSIEKWILTGNWIPPAAVP
jgi:hypothetical protein